MGIPFRKNYCEFSRILFINSSSSEGKSGTAKLSFICSAVTEATIAVVTADWANTNWSAACTGFGLMISFKNKDSF